MPDKQNLRTDVINVARQLFMSKGYENVGMRDIAQVLGQQPTQVYRLNLCKSDILAELILELNEAQIAKLPIIKTQIEGDTVLDTFLGSGTTALASRNTKRKFKGCEISKEYCDKINELINQ